MSREQKPRPPACHDDGALMAYLDDALEGPERRELSRHLTECDACRARLHELRARDRSVTEWIASADPEPPPRDAYDLPTSPRTTHRPGRWAAAAVLVLGLGVLAGPVRGWVVDGIQELLGSDEVATVVESGPSPTDTTPPGTGFVPEGPELTLEFTSPATRGRLVVEVTGDSLATLHAPHDDVELVVRPRSVRIENDASPDGDYRISLPSPLERLRVRTRAGVEAVVELDELEGARVLDLEGSHRDPSSY